jgi:hypothetical protein
VDVTVGFAGESFSPASMSNESLLNSICDDISVGILDSVLIVPILGTVESS